MRGLPTIGLGQMSSGTAAAVGGSRQQVLLRFAALQGCRRVKAAQIDGAQARRFGRSSQRVGGPGSQVSLVITERRNSVITETWPAFLPGLPAPPICASS